MDATETLAKLAGNEAVKELVGEEGLAALTGVIATAGELDKKFKDAEAKAGRILAEKKETQDKLTALETEVEALKESGLSDADKVKAETAKVIARAEKAEKDNADLITKFAASQRTVAMDKIAGSVKFIDALSPEAGRTLLNSHMAGIEDLTDQDAVTVAVDAFKESNKTLIAADSQAQGAGTPPPEGGAGGGGAGGIDPTKQSPAEREKYLQEQGIL